MAEQVNHKDPPVTAFHAEGKQGWSFRGAVGGDIVVRPTVIVKPSMGKFHSFLAVKLERHNEEYKWNKVDNITI